MGPATSANSRTTTYRGRESTRGPMGASMMATGTQIRCTESASLGTATAASTLESSKKTRNRDMELSSGLMDANMMARGKMDVSTAKAFTLIQMVQCRGARGPAESPSPGLTSWDSD